MAQYSVYINTNQSSKKLYPYVLDVQSPVLDALDTRLVIPLALKGDFGDKEIHHLTPSISVKGAEYLVLTPQMAAIHRQYLGEFVRDCIEHRQDILASIDFLITGF
ncbi:CcdB-like toxin protein [uncultured spirochete]|jgi:toxin CcdB|uniref:Toxin CcdB n=1 Tax=uncultured spirochete TaxID=156406 RepID=A0A3P3XT17_9SPIR|nr:CcdB-like toxin protein [uncultured spirochete]